MNGKELLDVVSARLGINSLNAMQRQVVRDARSHARMVLLSPTGSGKTLAFAVPLVEALSPDKPAEVQAVVMAPTRELVLQTAQVVRTVAVGHKVTACYGGHPVADERQSLVPAPAVIVATPGRLLDHVERGHVDVKTARFLVLDEFDKILELGFEEEMKAILSRMSHAERRILVSATPIEPLPSFVRMNDATVLNFLSANSNHAPHITRWLVASPDDDKAQTLRQLLLSLPVGRTLVFVNCRDTVEPLARLLKRQRIAAGMYHGAMDQQRRETAITLFRNGSLPVLVTTDLGARGLDIEGVAHVIHYHLPITEKVFTHRNGRTARVGDRGDVFLLTAPGEAIPAFAQIDKEFDLNGREQRQSIEPDLATLYINAGRKEKISRADVVGYITANGDLPAAEIGLINVSDHHTLVAVPCSRADALIKQLRLHKIKGRRVRVSQVTI